MLTLSLVTPAKKLLTDVGIEEVFVPTFSGELNILEGHAPLMATLETGILKYRLKGESATTPVVISWGYLEVSKDKVTVLAEIAETVESINIEQAKTERDEAIKALAKMDLDQHQHQQNQVKLERSIIRIEVAEKHH